jgi:hypothetical protein
MKKTLVLCVSWKGLSEPTAELIGKLEALGASKLIHVGVTDVSLARSMAFAAVLNVCDETPELDTLLLLDDDMMPTPEAVLTLVGACRSLDGPVSGVYGTKSGVVAATHRPGFPVSQMWFVGLGFFALPVRRLRELAAQLPHVRSFGKVFPVFCATGIHPRRPGEWTSEDYWFCLELGGVRLEPIPASHYKPKRDDNGKMVPFVITVPERTLEQVRCANLGQLPPAREDA